jgi:hypothetical protein
MDDIEQFAIVHDDIVPTQFPNITLFDGWVKVLAV